MSNDFDRCLAKVLIHEGGYVNNPNDPGGATNRGITQRVYDAYLIRNKRKSKAVKTITSQEVSAIYKASYWTLAKCDELPAGVDYVVFDGSVNSGVSQSIKWLQRAVEVNVDGVIGPATIAAVKAIGNDDLVVDRICDQRLRFLMALKTWKFFGKGWKARVKDVRDTGKAWADGEDAPITAFIDGASAKASIGQAKANLSTAPGDTAASGGGMAALLAQGQDQLAPYTQFGFVAKAVAVLTLVGLVVAVLGFGYRLWVKRRNNELKDALDIKVGKDADVAA